MNEYTLMFLMFGAGAVSAFVAVRTATRRRNADLRAELERARSQLQSTRTLLSLAEASERALLDRCEHLASVRSEDLRKLFPSLAADWTRAKRAPYMPGCLVRGKDRDDVVR